MNPALKIAEYFVEHRRYVAWFSVVMTAVTVLHLPKLKIDDNFHNLLKQSADAQSVPLEIEPEDNACLLLIEGGPILDAGNQDALRELVVRLKDVAQVSDVHSVFDARKPLRFGRYFLPLVSRSPQSEQELAALQAAALRHPMIGETMLARDGQATLVTVVMETGLQRASEVIPVIEAIEHLAAEVFAGTELTCGITGIPSLQVEVTEALKSEQLIFVSGALLVGMILTYLIFRRSAALLIVQSGPIMAVIWSVGGMAFIGEPLNVVNCVLAPLVLTIALTDSVHLVLRIRAERERGSERIAAVIEALHRVGPACFLTSLTTALAFASLGTSGIEVIRQFGWASSYAVSLAFVAVITVVPVLAMTRLGDLIVRGRPGNSELVSFWASRVDRFVGHSRILITCFSVISTAVLIWISTGLEPDIQMRQFLPEQGAAVTRLKRCEDIFGGLLPVYVVIDWDETTTQQQLIEAIKEVEQIIDRQPQMSRPLSILNVLQSLVEPQNSVQDFGLLQYIPKDKLERLIRFRDRRAVVMARIPDRGTRHVLPLYEGLQEQFQQLEQEWPGLRFRLSGWTVTSGRLSESMLSDLMKSLYLAVAISFLILAIAYRSAWLGLISLIPNLFPLAATSATMVWMDWPLHFSSATVFSVCFGIAVDDTIHFLSSYTHEIRDGARVPIAIRRTLQRVGEALVVSTLIMVCSFIVVTFSHVPSIREFALAFMVVLGWALVGDLIFLPALLEIAGRSRRKVGSSDKTA